jgi:hypothetical protein
MEHTAPAPFKRTHEQPGDKPLLNETNSRTGDSKQVYLHVEGPVCVAGATTRDKIYEDNANRSFLIQVEENPSHERQVLEYQGRLAEDL